MALRQALLCASLAVFGLVACGSDDGNEGDDGAWKERATEINDITCERVYECFEGADLRFIQSLAPELGTSAEECQDNLREQNESATQACEPGQSYSVETAEQCIIDLVDVECDSFMEWLPYGGPASCRKVCS